MINYDVKFITSDETLQLKNCDSKSYKYETKKRSEESLFDAGKRSYCERRGGDWRPIRPRQIKQLEGKLRDKTIVKTTWTTDSLVTIVFSSGVIAYLTVKLNSLDVTQVLFDRYFVGKLASQTVSNVALCKSHFLFTHNDRTATLVSFGKPMNGQPCRITDRDPSLHSIELGGGSRRTERHLSHCDTATGSRILVWSGTAAEPAPWSPVIEDSANLHLYQINGHNINLLAYHQLENETLSAELSHKHENIIHIVEQIGCQKNNISIEWSRYEVPSSNRANKLSSRVSTTRVSVPAAARVVCRAPCDSRLLVASLDGSLHVVHQVAGLTHSTKAGFIATEVRWVEDLIIAAEEGGRIQCFDRALSLLHHHTKCFELSSYLREPRRMQVLNTLSVKGAPIILSCFAGGPLALLTISHPRLLTAWVRCRRMSNAVALLRSMDWDEEGTECLWALDRLVCASLRSGPEAVAEECSAEAALGTYLAPVAPLGVAAGRFAQPVHDLARKFFHHLLRRGRLEKALSLAVEVSAWDVCRDARAAALRAGRADLAEEAAQLAAHYANIDLPGSECSDSCSECSSSTNSEAETSASSEVKTVPPPLPRVSLPLPLPALLPVSVTQPEPAARARASTIRPNLHQYLDRDNTIWNTEIKDNLTTTDNLKSILNTHHSKWNENGLPTFKAKNEQKSLIDIVPRTNGDRATGSQFRNVFETDLRENNVSNTLYRYQNNNYPNLKDRMFVSDSSDRQGNRAEKNKVKFSDTVTIAVVSQGGPEIPSPSRELADSLPLCAPHKYLAAFAPQPAPAPPPAPPPTPASSSGTMLDYVEV